jgi:hypothetical protein
MSNPSPPPAKPDCLDSVAPPLLDAAIGVATLYMMFRFLDAVGDSEDGGAASAALAGGVGISATFFASSYTGFVREERCEKANKRWAQQKPPVAGR